MTEAEEILRATSSVLLVDWPSRDVPETLARAGYQVFVKGGPEPDNFSVHELRNGAVEPRKLGHAPDEVDLVYAHRPLEELPTIVALAGQLGAGAVWLQSGSAEARDVVESAGLRYVDDVYIVDAVRESG